MHWLRRRAKAPPETARPPKGATGDRASALEGMHRLIELVREHPQADDQVLEDALIASGVDRAQATRLLLFVPEAFGRYITDEAGLRTDPTYYRVLPDETELGPFDLMDEVEFHVAVEHRDHLMPYLPGCQELAGRSAAVGFLHKVRAAGKDPRTITMGAARVYWDAS